jgi:hypothetical protein
MNNLMRSFQVFYSKYILYFSVFGFFWAVFALTNSGFDNSEGLFHYQVAEQIVKHGQLGFATPQDGIFIVAPNGRTYGGHEIGNTLFLLPTAFINVVLENSLSKFVSQETIEKLQQFILSFQAGAYCALTATIFFAILRNIFSITIVSSFIATLSLVFTTYYWTYSRNLYDGVLCTLLLTLSFFLLLKYRQSKNLWFVFSCFLCLGFALITRISMVLGILVSFTYLFSIRQSLATKFRELLVASLTLIPFVLWQCWYNYLRTGIFYKSAVQLPIYAENNAMDGNIFVGLTGLLFSPGKSLFIYAPLLILSLVLFGKFYKEYRKEAIYILSLTILWFLLHSKLRSWYGAWGWGPRHFITILPILFLPLAVNLNYVLQKTTLKICAIVLGSFGFVFALSSIISNWHFRLMYAKQRGLTDSQFIWNFQDNQAIDMLKGAFGNIVRVLTYAPIITIKDTYSEANEYVSSTVNVWVNSFIYAGIPWYIALLLTIPLLVLIYFSIRNILHLEAQYLANTKSGFQTPQKSL